MATQQMQPNKPSLDPMGDYKRKQLAGLFGGKDYVAPQEVGVKPQDIQVVGDPKPATPADSRSYTPTPPDEYEQLMSKLRGDKERQDREVEKRRKRAAVFAAIGDGLASLSNLFFTTKGAPNAYNPANSLSDAVRKRYDELQAKGDAEWRDKVRERIDDLKRKRAERIAAANSAAEQAAAEREYKLKQADLLRKVNADEAKKKLEQDELLMKKDVDASTIARNNAQARYYRTGGGGGRRSSGSSYNTEVTTTEYDSVGNKVKQTKKRSNEAVSNKAETKRQGRIFDEYVNSKGKGDW